MKGMWWKLLGLLLIFYSLVAGLLIPLKPGILSVSPGRANVGQFLDLEIKGYNTHFDESDGRAWLKIDEKFAIQAKSINPISPEYSVIKFYIPGFPANLNKKSAFGTLVVENLGDGTHVFPNAVLINGESPQFSSGSNQWSPIPNDLLVNHGLKFPYRNILEESIRNLFYHVTLWMAMVILLGTGVYHSIMALRKNSLDSDRKAAAITEIGLFYGILGLTTGMVWASSTWGKPWSGDVKQNMTAIALLIYLAYFILRGSFKESDQRLRISAVYNIFAFCLMIPLIYVIPRMTDSLHPGNGGNPGFGGEDLDSTMRLVFYPAIVGYILLGLWLAELKFRTSKIQENIEE
jgi:heme exporter protein C